MIKARYIRVEAGDRDEVRHYVPQVELLIQSRVVWMAERSTASESVLSLSQSHAEYANLETGKPIHKTKVDTTPQPGKEADIRQAEDVTMEPMWMGLVREKKVFSLGDGDLHSGI